MGGLLSAYQLSGELHPRLLAKAKEVGDKLAFAYLGVCYYVVIFLSLVDSIWQDNKIPYAQMKFETNSPEIGGTNIAEAGSLTMEWGALSEHTGNVTYRRLAEMTAYTIAAQV